jgi:hypothetical protein
VITKREYALQSISEIRIAECIEQWGAEHMRTPYRAEERKAEFLKMAGIWSETEEGEAHYQMMKHRNDERPLNREINFDH